MFKLLIYVLNIICAGYYDMYNMKYIYIYIYIIYILVNCTDFDRAKISECNISRELIFLIKSLDAELIT